MKFKSFTFLLLRPPKFSPTNFHCTYLTILFFKQARDEYIFLFLFYSINVMSQMLLSELNPTRNIPSAIVHLLFVELTWPPLSLQCASLCKATFTVNICGNNIMSPAKVKSIRTWVEKERLACKCRARYSVPGSVTLLLPALKLFFD